MLIAITIIQVDDEKLVDYDNFKADMFSFGVCAFAMMTGQFPFGTNSAKTDPRHLLAEPRTNDMYDKLSDQVKQVIRGFLQLNPQTRTSARGALRNKWFNSEPLEIREKELNTSILSNLDPPIEIKAKSTRQSTRLSQIAMLRAEKALEDSVAEESCNLPDPAVVGTKKGNKKHSRRSRVHYVIVFKEFPHPEIFN